VLRFVKKSNRFTLWPLLLALLVLALWARPVAAVTLTTATFTVATPTQTNQTQVFVKPGESITATVYGNTLGANTNWRATSYSILNGTGGTYTCIDTSPNNDNNNSATVTSVVLTMTAPATSGMYDANFLTRANDGCSGAQSAVKTMSNAIVVDGTAPIASIACTPPGSCASTPTNATSVTWTVTFDENVTGVATGNFTLTTSGLSGPSNTGTGNGTIALDLDTTLTGIIDRAGNNPSAVTGGGTYTIDKTAPVATVTCTTPGSCGSGNPTNASSVVWTVTFDKVVNGVSAAKFSLATTGLASASITSVTGTGPYTVTASTGTGSGTIALNMTATGITDAAGNNPAAVSAAGSYTIDKTPPTLSSIACSIPSLCGPSNSTNSSQVTWLLTFSETITALAASNFGFSGSGLTGATLDAPINLTGTTWKVTANVGVSGTLGLNLNFVAPAIPDALGNALTATVSAISANTYTINNQAPIATITCSVPTSCGVSNPTGATTVVWAVTFSENVTGLTLTDFTLTGTGISGASLTGISGSGSAYTVTATTGVNGTLELNLNANLATITDGGGLSPAAVMASPSNTYTKDSAATGECFTDNFTRANLGGDWATTSSGGTFGQPLIVGNRLRLTNSTTKVATAAHLQRVFPAAGNKVVVEFDYYSYNANNTASGTGADGMAVILSDATIAPVAGAFGGSLGYAQKNSAVAECAATGGCSGFAGGWIGIGLDEFGNYSVFSEGRTDGTSSLADAVVIRGSGFGQSGYRYHGRSLALSPGIDSPTSATANPGHRYRVTIDHTDGVHAYVSVDRDATPGHTGYTNVVAAYDAKAKTGQAAVPDNWFLSYTGSTGDNSNTHEIAALSVCTTRPIAVPTLHHVRIVHDGAARTCTPETVTLRACADATCSSLYLGSVTADLTAVASSTWSSDPVTFTGGQTTVTLSKTGAGTAVLGGTVTLPTPTTTALQCYNEGTAGDCNLPFTAGACSFDALESTLPSTMPRIYTKLAGTSFNIDVMALTNGNINTASVAPLSPQLVDQNSLPLDANGCGATVLANASPTSYTLTAGDQGRKTFSFTYAHAAPNVRVKITSGVTTACSSDNFAIRPTTFAVTSNATQVAAIGTPTFKAGYSPFQINATPKNSSNATTSYYTGIAVINNNLVDKHSGGVIAGVVTGTFSPSSAGTSWISSGASFKYSEVGSFMFKDYGVYDDGSFAVVDGGKASPECFTDNYLGSATAPQAANTADGNGMYACYFGNSASTYMGRFIPDRFDTVISQVGGVPMTCPSGLTCPTTFNGAVYSNQEFTLKVIAKRYGALADEADGVTMNYAGSYAKAVTLGAWAARGSTSQANPPVSPSGNALFRTSLAATDFSAGIATKLDQKYTFGSAFVYTSPVATSTWSSPTDIYIRAAETSADAVTTVQTVTTDSVEAGVKVISGRFFVSHAYGSELLRLRVPVFAQYWNGSRWVNTYVDSVSTYGSTSVNAPTNFISRASGSNALSSSNTAVVAQTSATLVNGAGQFYLSAPGAGVSGSADLRMNSPAWLPTTTGRIKFGTYRSPLIYMREVY
jgi:hypothetical protein